MSRLSKTVRSPIPLLAACLLALSTGLIGPQSTKAQEFSERIFTAYRVAVDVRARTTAAAKAAAIAEAERRGLEIVLGKILSSDDVGLIPLPEERLLQRMLRGLEVGGERSSATRYLAEFTVTFDARQVGDYLQRFKVEFSEIEPKTVVLLPVYRSGGADILWTENNAWALAWQAAGYNNRLMHYVQAEGDLADRRLMPTHSALHGPTGPQVSKFLERYGAEDALTVVAEKRQDGRTGRTEMFFAYHSGGGLSGQGRIQAGPEDDDTALLERAAEAIMTRLDIRWRELTAVGTDQVAALRLRMPIETIGEWVSVRQRIERVAIIQALDVNYLAVPESEITIRYVGGMDRLRLSLSQESLDLTESDRGWILTEAAPAGSVTEQEGGLK